MEDADAGSGLPFLIVGVGASAGGVEGARAAKVDQPRCGNPRTQADRHLLRRLALDRREWAAGIVLSGGGGDGTVGVRAIKERGGVTLAQRDDAFGPQHPDTAATLL